MANTTYTVGSQTFEVNSAGTIVGGNNNGYGYQYSNSAAPAPAASTPSIVPSVSSSTGNSGSSGGSSTPSIIPSVSGASMGTSGNSQSALANYANPSNTAARDAEIARAQAVYRAQAALGNWDAANSAHDWANQVRNAGGLAGTYNIDNGVSLIPNANLANTMTTPIIPTITQPTQIQTPTSQLTPIPTYTPYVAQEFQQTIPNYSVTSDPSKTVFIPTVRAKDRWAQQEQNKAENAYKGYTSQMGAYTQDYQQQQDAIVNAINQKKLENETVAQKAKAAIEAVNAKTDADKNALAAAQNRWQTLGYVANEADATILGVPVGTQTNDASYRDASLAAAAAKSGGGSSLSGSGGISTANSSSNPFSGSSGEQTDSQSQILGFDVASLDAYISNLRASFQNPEDALAYLQATSAINPTFNQAVQQRMNAHITN